jgi:hypothetical protein
MKKKNKKNPPVAPRNPHVVAMVGKGRVFADKRRKRERKFRHKVTEL